MSDPYASFGSNTSTGVVSAFLDNTAALYAAVAIPLAIGVITGVGMRLLRRAR